MFVQRVYNSKQGLIKAASSPRLVSSHADHQYGRME